MKKKDAFPNKTYATRKREAEQNARFHQHPILVSKEFRQAILERFPRLDSSSKKEFYWKLLQYIIFITYTDKFEDDWGDIDENRIVIPHTSIAAMANKQPYGGGFRSSDLLDAFSTDIFMLNYSDWNKAEGRARTASPTLDAQLIELIERERNYKSENRVFFHDGKKGNTANIRKANRERITAAKNRNATIPSTHPAKKLLHYLNSRPQVINKKIVSKNWPSVERAAIEKINNVEVSQGQVKWLQNVVKNAEGFEEIYYHWVEGSPRIYAHDMTINTLPSDLRKIAFTDSGSVELDLKACQLAIVAAKWNVPSLREALEKNLNRNHTPTSSNDWNIWSELLSYVEIENEAARFKPILKDSVYSIIFGMAKSNIKKQLSEGNFASVKKIDVLGKIKRTPIKQRHEGIGEAKAKHLLNHPYLKELIHARGEKIKELRSTKEIYDAFGNAHKIPNSGDITSVLSYVVQSYELRLMLAAFDKIYMNNRIYVLSFLHDGMSLNFGNESKMNKELKDIVHAVNELAKRDGIPTELEVNYLRSPTKES